MRSMLTPLRRTLAPLFEHGQLLMIAVSTVLVMMGQGVISPVLPLFAHKFGVGSAAIGLTLSSFGLARLILNIPMGMAADRYGRRLLLVSGPLVAALGMIGSGFAETLVQLIAWRFLAGAGSAIYATGAQVFLADISTPATRARFLGTNQGALLLGTAVGPAVGGFAAEAWGLRAPFIIVGAVSLLAMAYGYLRLPETRHLAAATLARERVGRSESPPASRAWLGFVRSRDFQLVAIANLAIFFTRTGGKQTILPLFGAAALGISTGMLGGIFTMMALINMILVVPAALIADRFGRKWSIVPSGLLVAISLFMLAGSHTYAMFFGAALVHAVSVSLAGPAPAAYAVDISPPGLRGLGLGLFRSAGDIGFMIGPPLLGMLADASSFGWALVANGILMAVASALFLFARETVTLPGRTPARVPAQG